MWLCVASYITCIAIVLTSAVMQIVKLHCSTLHTSSVQRISLQIGNPPKGDYLRTDISTRSRCIDV